MKRISDAATRRALLDLKAQLTARAATLSDAVAKQEELQDRAASLRSRVALEEAAPMETVRTPTNLADALASDPTADLGGAGMQALVDDQMAIERAAIERRARVQVLKAAAIKLDGPIAAAARAVAHATIEHTRAARALRAAYHAALVTEFRTRFLALREEVIDPMLAIGIVEKAGGSPTIVEWGDVIALKTRNPGAINVSAMWKTEILLRTDDHGMIEREVGAEETVAALIADLAG